MINLRYHIVSIVAIFLALALGVAVGSAFIDDATIATLENRLDDLQAEIDATEAQNEELIANRDRLLAERDLLAADAGEELLGGRIEEQPLLLVTATGTRGETLRAVYDTIEDSGAALAGTLRVTAAARPAEGEDLSDLAEVVDSPSTGLSVWSDVWEEFVSAAVGSAESGADAAEPVTTTTVRTTTTTTTTTTTSEPDGARTAPTDGGGTDGDPSTDATTGDADTPTPSTTSTSTTTSTPPTTTPDDRQVERAEGLVELVEEGVDLGVWTFEDTLAIDLADAFGPGASPHFVIVADDDSAELAVAVLGPLLERLAVVRTLALAVVAEPSPDRFRLLPDPDEEEGDDTEESGEGDDVPSLVATVRETPDMAARISTVDDIDRFAGRVALVLALEDLPDGVGQYGVRPSATAFLPGR